MPYPRLARDLAQRHAPGFMANRARRYERGFRQRHGVTEAAQRIVAEHGAIVQAGPFVGMRYPVDRIADVDAPSGKLLGVYEHEIYPPFRDAIARSVHTFIDVGCADGYYAVGMPFAGRGTVSYAFDLAASARELCGEVARSNAVQDRVRIGKRFELTSLDSIDMTDGLMLCDIEGGEAALFDRPLVERLANTTVVIEVHESDHPGLSDDLTARFSASHRVRRIDQAPRDSDLQEFRPPELHWLVCDWR